MKTRQEIAKLLFLPEFGKHVNVDALVEAVATIQQDAFESGRVAGLREAAEISQTKPAYLTQLILGRARTLESTPPTSTEK